MSDELTKVRVLIVSLDRLSRAGLAAELDQQLGLVVVGQIAGDEDSSLPLGVYDPDVIVRDVSRETAPRHVTLNCSLETRLRCSF